LITLTAALGSAVDPWPRDGWYQTLYFLFGSFPLQDDYTPIAAPAVLYWLVHRLAAASHLDLAGEFYLASLVQNALVFLSACFVYFAGRLLGIGRIAGFVAVGFLLLVLSTGLPQAFWSENVALFLMAFVLLTAVMLLRHAGDTNLGFWCLTVLCSLSIAALVVTRMTPIILIPGLALLFLRRLPVQNAAVFTLVAAITTALVIFGTASANQQRFGRYEITNSSGRHLWQGVKFLSDRALANSAQYQALKKRDADIQGKDWWNLPIGDEEGNTDQQDALLKKLAKEAISNEPVAYLRLGLRNFATTIGAMPYRLGYGAREGHWNPLDRETPLPALLESKLNMGPVARLVAIALKEIHRVAIWVYPLTIFAILVSYAAMIIGRVNRPFAGRACNKPRALFLGGIPLSLLAVSCLGLSLDALVAGALCLLLLTAFCRLLGQSSAEQATNGNIRPSRPRTDFALYSFFALAFFGSLWFSWQVEVKNSRNALPYLPFWAAMLGLALSYWTAQSKTSRSQRTPGVPTAGFNSPSTRSNRISLPWKRRNNNSRSDAHSIGPRT
jgi:hypothetical protein